MAELQVVRLEGSKVVQAKNIPTSLLAGESGTSSSSSTLYLLPLDICFLSNTTSLLMKLHGWPNTSQLVKSHLRDKEVAVVGRMAQYKAPYKVTAKEMEKADTDTMHNNLFKLSPTQ